MEVPKAFPQKKPRSKCGVYGLLLLSQIQFLLRGGAVVDLLLLFLYVLFLLVLLLLFISVLLASMSVVRFRNCRRLAQKPFCARHLRSNSRATIKKNH